MRPAKKYILINTLIALAVLITYSLVAVARFQDEQQNEAARELERSLATMKELLAAKGELRKVNGTLMAGDYVINGNYEIPDIIEEIFEGAATIFLDDVRISTNIRTSDGKRATGTRLQGPPYQTVIKEGRRFTGEALILGVPYLTVYEPIRDQNGKLIGILFAGVKKSVLIVTLHHLKTQLYLLLLVLILVMAIPAILITRLTSREEEARHAQVKFLQTLMDTIPNPIFYKDIHGRFLGCNKATENALGVPREQLIGKTVADVIGGEPGEIHRRTDDEVISKSEIQMYEAKLTLKDGNLHDVVFYKAAFPDAVKGVGGIIGTFVDVTDIKNFERALREEAESRCLHVAALAEKDKMLMQQNRQAVMGEMIGNIAHQWRQPLNTLALIFQELLITYQGGGFTEEYLATRTGRIKDLIHHMSETVDEFTKFFRPGKAAAPFMPSQVITRTLGLIEASMKNIEIEIRMNVTADAEVVGYSNEYSQVILNVIMNARDTFCEREIPLPRIIRIDVTTSAASSLVTITDNAGGIPDNILAHIFDSYFTTKESTGTGIGLYLARTIIEKNMNGILSGQNTVDGAAFRIEVPLKGS
ncbi:cache domain-containing protein [Pelotalea chapellei]|uniref:histidine kinase n=1 Tax=Pelotalea chapellei TaxID=44671 RepID=A0ABS5UB10_9BACT|nr:cache domain-containing protein [Pelotalea chapellei]MBT1072854.1 cache domain-containing protein [Pelotalea chapellei]